MAIEAWFMEDNDEDQRLPHHSNPKEFVSPDHLTDIGVLYWQLDPNIYENDKELQKIRQERGYNYMDLLDLCHANMENYEQQLRNYYIEHIHVDEEIRYCLEESGYFDVRDKEDSWIHIWIKPGDLIILSSSIYHRFTLDTTDYIKADEVVSGRTSIPVCTAYNRPQDNHHLAFISLEEFFLM
ncbi:Ard4p [Orobanche minor]